ncbi:MAG: DUF2726 domain-containing protein [Kiritimatiellae bacterium]|nr:DUF2726 domain-containing protein [Kiritimatiellia bacterium]MCO5069353.1 DUF2726 domain-containing protein [Kiritimatiellia bacterium]
MQQLLLPAIVLLIIAMVINATLKVIPAKQRSVKALPLLYEKEDGLMSPTELLFFRSLEAAVSGHFRLFSKVRLADIIRVKRGTDRRSWQSAFNAIQSKHVDFLAVDPVNMTIQFAIELDDKSHQKPNRKERDVFVDKVLAGAGIPLFRFPAQRSYSEQNIRSRLFDEQR